MTVPVRIKKLSIKSFRGIPELNLDFDGKNQVFRGDNGSGKSSIVEGLEFFFTGDLKSLQDTQGLSLIRHAPHVNSSPDDVNITLTFDPGEIILRPNCEDTEKHRLYYQGHMAMISSLDRDFGEILKKLEEKGIEKNSIIVFTSDHGDMLESHGWPFNKGRPEIESIRVPLIIKWADGLEPRVSDLLVGTLDLMPTLLGMMDLPVPETCQGKDLSKPVLEKNDSIVESVPLFYFSGDWRGVYTHEYTYAFSLDKGKAEPHAVVAGFKDYNVLYDHKNDPFELNNLFEDTEFMQQKNALHNLSLEWMNSFKDEGVPYKELLPKIMMEEDYIYYQKPPAERGTGWEGRVKGPPVTLL